MKKLIAIAALMASFSAMATEQTTATAGTTTANANAESVSKSQASNQGNTQTIVFEAEDTTTRSQADKEIAGINAAVALEIARINSEAKIRNTPSVNASPLTSSNDTCMGSSSGSINAPGIGIALGSTWVDENCKMLKNSRELWNMGMKAAALALMCTDENNRTALELTGFICPQTTAKSPAPAQVRQKQTSAAYTGNDPIVLQRLNAAQ